MPDVGLTTSSEPLPPDAKIVIKYTVEVEGLPVYTETYSVDKLEQELETVKDVIVAAWMRRIECVIRCRKKRGFSACVTRCLIDGVPSCEGSSQESFNASSPVTAEDGLVETLTKRGSQMGF